MTKLWFEVDPAYKIISRKTTLFHISMHAESKSIEALGKLEKTK